MTFFPEYSFRCSRNLSGVTIPYLAGLFRSLFGYRNKAVVVDMENKIEAKRVLSVVIANGGYVVGGMHKAPKSELGDTLLDVLIIGDMGKFELLKTLPTVYKVTHISMESSERLLVHCGVEQKALYILSLIGPLVTFCLLA